MSTPITAAQERDNWKDTAEQYGRNAEHYKAQRDRLAESLSWALAAHRPTHIPGMNDEHVEKFKLACAALKDAGL